MINLFNKFEKSPISYFDLTSKESAKKEYQKVKDILKTDVNFIIAGGSVGDSLNKNAINDIDIYFEYIEDFNQAKIDISQVVDLDTPFASSYIIDNNKIQLIKCKLGYTDMILSTFDLNKSQIALTKDGVIEHNNFNKPLYFIKENFNTKTPNRIIKYIEKGYIPEPMLLRTMFEHLLIKAEYDSFYEDNKTCTNYWLAVDFIKSISPIIFKSIRLREYIESYLQIEHYEYLSKLCFDKTYYNNEFFSLRVMTDMMIEKRNSLLLSHYNVIKSSGKMSELYDKYPEMFI